MFLALRELKFARGRFSLMGVVIALIAVLMVLLSGLSAGLVNDGVSGLKSLPASTAFAFDAGTKPDNAFSRSVVDDAQLNAWRDQRDVAEAAPMGVAIVNAVTDAGEQVDLTPSGVEPGSFPAPAATGGPALDGPAGIIVSGSAQGLELGSVVTLDRIDTELEVVGFTDEQATFGHVDVAYL